MFRGRTGCPMCWQPNLVPCKNLLGVTGFEGTKVVMENIWGLALWEARRGHWWNVARVAVKAPILKGSWRKFEALHHEESPGEATGKVPFSYSRRHQHFGGSSTMGWLLGTMEWTLPELRRQTEFAADGGGGGVTQALKRLKDYGWIPDIRHQIIYTVGMRFHFVQIVTMSCSFLLAW